MTVKLFAPVILACLLVQLSACKKEDKQNMLVSNSRIIFAYDETNKMITISNAGSTEFTWSVSTASDLLEFSKKSGTCSKNKPDSFVITVRREKVHKDSISAIVSLTASTGETASISLLIMGFPEKKIRYNSQVYNAAFDPVHNQLVLLSYSNSSMVLDIYNLATEKFSHVTLPENSDDLLSVSPDGAYAVTSSEYNTRITYTDLVQKKVINSFSLEEFDNVIIASPNGFCYYFPYYNNDDFGKLNLSTGNYTTYSFTQSINPTTAVLHPSGNYIYTAGYYTLAKINIANPEPVLIYASSSNNIGSKLWISKDGNKLFTSVKKVLTLNSSLPANDITGVADVPISQNYIHSLDHNLVNNEYYIIPSNSSYEPDYQSKKVLVLKNDLSPSGTVALEPFYISNPYSQPLYTTMDPLGEYVFSSSDGNKMIIVSKAESYSYFWGIEIIDRNWK